MEEIKHELINEYNFKLIKEDNKSYFYLLVSDRLKLVLFKELLDDESRLCVILKRCKRYLPIEVKYGVKYRELSNALSIAYSKNNFEMIQNAKYNLNELIYKIESEFGKLDNDFRHHMV